MLNEAGVVVVQMENPSEFRLIRARVEPEFEAGELLKAAIVALSPASDATYGNADRNRAEFFKALVKSIGEGK
jgi:hypothetical protein